MKPDQTTQSGLELLRKNNKTSHRLRELLQADPQRFDKFSLEFSDILFDFSRVAIDAAALEQLIELADAAGLERKRERMFKGEVLNITEHRAVLHHLWRSRTFSDHLSLAESDACQASILRMQELAATLHSGILPGNSDARVKDIIHIGIGGSLIGPKLLCEAMPQRAGVPSIHFLSSVDAFDREQLLARLDPRSTLVVLVSKSFGTSEVLLHGRRIQAWLMDALGQKDTADRFIAVTAAPKKAQDFGVPLDKVLAMGEWTGGRYSIWSPVGLTAAISAGPEAFEQFCAGGAAMDEHFRTASLAENLPVIHGLLSCWHRNVCGYAAKGLIPYDSRLKGLPSWLQQLQMESNGKSVLNNGQAIEWDTSPVVLGDCGTDAQHALFQAFHQGTEIVPLDFIGVVRPDHADLEAQDELLANLLAQATALALGRNSDETREMMRQEGKTGEQIEALLPHRIMPGNRPSSILMLDRLTPWNLGALLVLYEHSIFVESVIWDINAFDQWGVELGKVLANQIVGELGDQPDQKSSGIAGLDPLLNHIRSRRPIS